MKVRDSERTEQTGPGDVPGELVADVVERHAGEAATWTSGTCPGICLGAVDDRLKVEDGRSGCRGHERSDHDKRG